MSLWVGFRLGRPGIADLADLVGVYWGLFVTAQGRPQVKSVGWTEAGRAADLVDLVGVIRGCLWRQACWQ